MSLSKGEVVIFEGPQGSGKTTCTDFFESRGYVKVRGIPEGEELIRNSNLQNWDRTTSILKDHLDYSGGRIVMDRSILSLIAFQMRKRPTDSKFFYDLGRNNLCRTLSGINYRVVFLAGDPSQQYERNMADTTPAALKSFTEYLEEGDTYDLLFQRLYGDNFNVKKLVNKGTLKELEDDLRNI